MDMSELQSALETVVAIPVTPFNSDGEIDTRRYASLVNGIVKAGVAVCTPNGNTGEFYSLAGDREWLSALDAALDGAEGATVMPGIGLDIETAIRLARHAESRGAAAVMVHQPIHPFQSEEGWLEYHRAIAGAVPELGLVPYVRNAAVGSSALARLVDDCPNVVGVKYAVPDALRLAGLIHDVGMKRVAWICGLAEPWAPFFFVAGSRGFTSGLVNVAPAMSFGMLKALREGNYSAAIDVWRTVRPFEDLRARRNDANNVSTVKEALAQLDRCRRDVRPPISELDETERAEVTQILVDWGML